MMIPPTIPCAADFPGDIGYLYIADPENAHWYTQLSRGIPGCKAHDAQPREGTYFFVGPFGMR